LAANLQPKGTGQQYLGILSKGDGQGSRIQEEMADMGLDTWLQSKGKVSRDEVLDYIGENRLRYGKTLLNDEKINWGYFGRDDYLDEDVEGLVEAADYLGDLPEDIEYIRMEKYDDGIIEFNVGGDVEYSSADGDAAALDWINNRIGRVGGDTK